MRSALLLALCATTLAAQERSESHERMLITVRSADSTRETAMDITLKGSLFWSLGVEPGKSGRVHMGPGERGTGTGALYGELSDGQGEIKFSAPLTGPLLEITVFRDTLGGKPRLYAKGNSVSVSRDTSGRLAVRAGIW